MERIESSDIVKIKYPRMLYSFILLAALCIFGGGNKVLSIVVLAALSPLILTPEYLLGPLLFSSIWSGYILVAGSQSLARYLTIFFLAGVLIKMINKGTPVKVDFWFKTTIAAILLGVALSFWGIHDYVSFPWSYVLNLLLFLAMLYCPITSKELLVRQIWLFACLSIAYAYWFLLRNGLDAFEAGKISTEDGVNSNSIGKGLCVIGIIILAHFIISRLRGKFIHVALILVTLFLIFLTGSRTSLVAILISGIITVLFYMKLNARRIMKAILLIILIIGGCYFVYQNLLEALPVLMSRFTLEDTLSDGGTGRIDVWKAYITEYLPDYWLFGTGFDPLNLFRAVERVNGIGHGAHNHIIDILASTGIVGLVLYSWMHIKGLSIGAKYSRKDITMILPWSMLIATLFLGIGENVLRGKLLWFSLALIIMLRNIIDKEYSESEEEI